MHHSNKKPAVGISLAAMLGLSSVGMSAAFAQNPHVHGAAAMNMVVDGEQLLVEFQAPLASVVGFEYQPQSRVEKMKLKKAVSALESASLFQFTGAECELVKADAKTPWPDAKRDEHDHDEHHDHDHDEHHDHDHDEDHDEDHEHEHDEHHDHDHDEEHEHGEEHGYDHKEEHDHHEEHGKETHSDIELTYEFTCKGKVESVTLDFFNKFELMENIKVQWITEAGQGAETLTAGESSFSF